MDRNEIAKMYNVSPKALTAISQGNNWGYILPELNDNIHNLKQTLIDERNQMIVSHYDNGLKITEIVNLTGLSTSIVEKAVYKYRDIKSKDSQMEKYNKIFELHNQGINNYQISKIVGVSPSTVQRYLSGEQHPLNKPSNKKITDEIESKVIDMYFNDNLGSVEIGKLLDLSKTTVMNIVNNFKNKSTTLSGVSA
jgi:transposase